MDTVFGMETDFRYGDEAPDGYMGRGWRQFDRCRRAADLAETLISCPSRRWIFGLSPTAGRKVWVICAGCGPRWMRYKGPIGACIVFEGMGLGRIVHRALGSRRLSDQRQCAGWSQLERFWRCLRYAHVGAVGAELTRLRVPDTPRTSSISVA